MNLGYKVHGVICGFDGLMTGDIKEIDFMEVEGYVCACGPDATHWLFLLLRSILICPATSG